MNIFVSAFAKVYSPDSYDVAAGEFNYRRVKDNDPIVHRYRHHPLILFTTFFGLPNQFDLHEKPTWRKIGKNFLGLQVGKNKKRTRFNRRTIWFAVPKNFLFALFITAQNIIKLPVEFIPALFAETCSACFFPAFKYFRNSIRESWTSPNAIKSCILLFFVSPLLPVFLVAKMIFAAARTITSPVTSVKAGWFMHRSINDLLPVKKHPVWKLVGYAAGLFLSALSIAATMTAYMILFPMLISITPQLGIAMSPALASFAASLGATTGFCLSVFGTIINKFVDVIKKWWRSSAPAVMQQKIELKDEENEKEDASLDSSNDKGPNPFDDPTDDLSYIFLPNMRKIDTPTNHDDQEIRNTYNAEPGTSSNAGLFRLPTLGSSDMTIDKGLDNANSPRGIQGPT